MLALLCALAAVWPDANDILARADAVRNPADSYVMRAQITSSDNPSLPSLFEVAIQGNEKTLVKTLEPKRDRGRNLLMLGEEVWAYLPNLERTVRVSLAQRLSGQAANGDISRMRWSGDYTPRMEREDNAAWTLRLTAKRKGLTYDRLRVWVEKQTYRPLKAELLTDGGRPFKLAIYTHYRDLAGALRPTEIVLEDAEDPQQRSSIEILAMEQRDLPAALFHLRSLQ